MAGGPVADAGAGHEQIVEAPEPRTAARGKPRRAATSSSATPAGRSATGLPTAGAAAWRRAH